MEDHIRVFLIRDSVFQIWFTAEFCSSRFCWVHFSLFLCLSVVHGEFDWRICSSPTVCSQFRYESSTGTRYLKLVLQHEIMTGNLDWNPHICRCGQNMFFYNCYIRKQLLIILLCHQSFIVLSCNTINLIIKYTNDTYLISTLHYTRVLQLLTI